MKKKFAVKLLAAALLMASMIFADVSSGNVLAEESSEPTKDFCWRKVTDVSVYRAEGNYTYPKPTEEGKEDYVFAGWYTTEDCTTAYTKDTLAGVQSGTSVYAKYVPAETMDVKFQVTNGTNAASEKSSLRMVSSVDSLNYQTVGFKIKSLSTGQEKITDSTKVFKRIKSSTEGLEYGYSPIIFDTDSEYFVTATINNIKDFNKIYSVSSYWITMDGTTVYGTARNARVSDSYNKIANVPVRIYTDAESVSLTDLKVTYDTEDFTYLGYETGVLSETAAATATPTDDGAGKTTLALAWETAQTVSSKDGMLINLRFQVNDSASSNESFEVTSESVASGLFGYTYHVYASYDPEKGADTSWYDEFADGNEFVITTGNDLYGLAKLVNDGKDTFASDVVYLGADITINTDTFDPDAEDWATVSGNYAKWTPIGTTNAFAGTFDGQGQTISGVYYTSDDTSVNHGLFSSTASGSVLQKIYLENSYFEFAGSAKTPTGSIVGLSGGNLNEIYSRAYVKSAYGNLGGLVGAVSQEESSEENTISNCWFDGKVLMERGAAAANYEGVAGIIGRVTQGKVNVTDCLNSANIVYSTTKNGKYHIGVGGIIGVVESAGTIVMDQCLNAKDITIEGTISNTPRVAGLVSHSAGTVTLTNSYSVAMYYTNGDGLVRKFSGTYTKDESNAVVESVTGHLAYVNANNLGFYNRENNITGEWFLQSRTSPVPKCFAKEWIDVKDIEWYYGTENYSAGNNTFTINTAEELYAFADIASTYKFETDTVMLGADIVVNSGDASIWSAEVQPEKNWTPIGTEDNAFAGIFDGQGHTISGIYHISSDASTNHGLFDTTAEGSTLQNFRLENSRFELAGIGAKTPLGSVAGKLNGNMDCVYSSADVVSVMGNIGGLAGIVEQSSADASNSITNCWHNGMVELNRNGAVSNEQNVGGLVGCVVAGSLGIESCLKTGEIVCTFRTPEGDVYNKGVGGLIGNVCSNSTENGSASIADTIMAASMLAQYNDDGVITTLTGTANNSGRGIRLTVGYGYALFTNVYTRNSNSYAIVHNKTDGSSNYSNRLTQSQLKGYVAYSNTCTYDSETATHQGIDYYHPTNNPEGNWVIREYADSLVEGVPIPKVFADEWIDVAWYYDNVTAATDEVPSPADEYTISTPEELYGLSEIATVDTFENDTISLANDIQMNDGLATDWANGQTEGARVWTAIGNQESKFAGEFDGLGHTISGIYLYTNSQYAGLFGYVSDAAIKNIKLENSFFDSETTVEAYVGSITGCADSGVLENVYSNATVHSTFKRTGGFVGYGGTKAGGVLELRSCWFDGAVKIVMDSVETQTGGFIGYGRRVLLDTCLCSGTVTWDYNNHSSSARNAVLGGLVGTMSSSDSIVEIKNSISAANMYINVKNVTAGTAVNRYGLVQGYSLGTLGETYIYENVYSVGTVTITYEGGSQTITQNTYNAAVGTNDGIDNSYVATDIYGANASTLLTNLLFTAEEGIAYWVTTDTLPVPVTLSGQP